MLRTVLRMWSVLAAGLYLVLAVAFAAVGMLLLADDAAAVRAWGLLGLVTVGAGVLLLAAALRRLPWAAAVAGFVVALGAVLAAGSSGILLFPFALMNAPMLLLRRR